VVASLAVPAAGDEAVAVTMWVVVIGVHGFSSVECPPLLWDTLTIYRERVECKQDVSLRLAHGGRWPPRSQQRRFADPATGLKPFGAGLCVCDRLG
jgi:hypothetical protein